VAKRGECLLIGLFQQPSQNGGEFNDTLNQSGRTASESDPTLVESVEHLGETEASAAVTSDTAMAGLKIGAMQEHHWDAVRAIYQAGIDTGHATFASSPPESWAVWQRDHLSDFSVVAVEGEKVVGWASLAPVSGRSVYLGVAEVSVYVDPTTSGRGIGTQVLAALIERSEHGNVWTLQAGIFPENKASVALHTGLAFEVVGTRRRLGKMTFGPLRGQWRDVLLLERRSVRVGID